MIVDKMSLHHSVPVFIIVLLALISQQVQTSGVFELELIKFQPLDVRPVLSNEPNSRIVENSNNQEGNNVVRLLVCLKEAFTSNLDGPCTFGNASITLNKDLMQQEASSDQIQSKKSNIEQRQTNMNNNSTATNIQQQQHQAGSFMTNVVRILFTFRWTKSFTIILTAEEPQTNGDKQLLTIQSSSEHVKHQAQDAANKSTIDLSTVKKSTREMVISQPINRSLFKDRHVLTENEFLPNLDSNPNKPWSNRFSRSLKSSLAYRFRVYCSLNYYGDGCTTFCRARDDQFGHYNCSTTGQKVCLDGWNGPDCDKAKCRSGCNQQHGYCDKPDTCQCRPGWTGARCDECITYPGCQNGYCLGPWQCICQRNWGGVLCDQDLNYCGTHEPCKNNGTCQNVAPGKFRCNCLDGFTGADCELVANTTAPGPGMGSLSHQFSAGCAQNPCLNGGTCYGFNSLLVDSAIVGPVQTEADSALMGEHETERFYRCQCSPGWSGDYCQWSDASSLPVTSIITESTVENSMQTNGTASTVILSAQSDEKLINETGDNDLNTNLKISTYLTHLIESPRQMLPAVHQVDMKHFISGVVIASIFGVFLAVLLLAWCCLIAIERNRFSFIQMNIIRGGDDLDQPVVTSTLRRMHAKIRDSLRRSSRNRIKPETKLSIENVLTPPPTYEESSKLNREKVFSIQHYDAQEVDEKGAPKSSREDSGQDLEPTERDLVIVGTSKEKLATSNIKTGPRIEIHSNTHLTCPRHGHLYKQHQQALNDTEMIYTLSTKKHPSTNYLHRKGQLNNQHYQYH